MLINFISIFCLKEDLMDSLTNFINQFKVEQDSGIIKIKEQFILLEKKLKLLESENYALKYENQNLKAVISNLQKVNTELKGKLDQPLNDDPSFEKTQTLSPLINNEEGFTEKEISDMSLKILKKHGVI